MVDEKKTDNSKEASKHTKKETKKIPKGAKKKEKFVVPKVKDPYEAVKFVLMTEKAVQMIERDNKIIFVANRKSNKKKIKDSVEAMFNTPVVDVKTVIDTKGRKRAFVKFEEEGKAGDIAIKLGII
jgi:ribosomal protein L23